MSRGVLAHRPELDEFLFAAIGEERNGMLLTVASALGRLGLDPWREADRFSAMSKTAAAKLLTPMIARLPEGLWVAADAQAIAGRLVELLPAAPSISTAPGAPKPAAIASWLFGAALLATIVLTMTIGRDLSFGRFFESSPSASRSIDDPQPSER
jgi:hypothetical protein